MRRKGRRRAGCGLAIVLAMMIAVRAGAAGETVPGTEASGVSPAFPETEAVYLDIDSHHKYEGMEQSFSEGYQPVVKDKVLYLVIPFTASGELAGNRLTVSLIFSDSAAQTFLPRNYQKTVEKKPYVPEGGTMVCLGEGGRTESPGQTESSGEEVRETYLYCAELPLSGASGSGPCSITVQAVGYTERMEQVSFNRRILLSLPEEGKQGGEDNPEDKNGGGSGDGEAGNQAGGGENGENGEGSEKGEGGEPEGEGAVPGENSAEEGGGSFGGGGEELIRQPKILLESDNLSGKELTAGSEETFTATFRNCSGSQPLYNLKAAVSAQAEGIRFSRNSFYVAQAAPGESIVLETELTITPDAAYGEFPLIFEFEYEDKRGNAVSGRETVLLSVRQPAELECRTGEVPGVIYASDTMELSLKACNVGRAPIYNVQAGLSAQGLFSEGEVFLGNLEAGAMGEGMMHIYVGTRTMEAAGVDEGGSDGEKYGPVEGTVTFRYEDADGKIYEETKPFRTEIKKAQVASFAVEEPEETNSWWASVAAVTFAGLVLWVLLLLFRLRKKNALLAERRGAE